MRGVAISLYDRTDDVEIYGFENGYKGMIYGHYHLMNKADFEPILDKGGTILGSSREPFKLLGEPGDNGENKVESMVQTFEKLELDCLVVLGGNGSHKTANLLMERGMNVVTLPKTIDNDIYGTDMTFGFQSAVGVAARDLRCIQTTAESHSRIFIVEIMGHKTGWLTLHAGIAGGADVILLPEFPYEVSKVVEKIHENEKNGKNYSIIAVAEGAYSSEYAELPKKERKAKLENGVTAAYRLASEIRSQLPEKDIRIQIPGHTQRGGEPCPYDCILASRLGAAAADYILHKQFGVMAGLVNGRIIPVPLNEVAGKLKTIPQDDQLVQQAKVLGICIGR